MIATVARVERLNFIISSHVHISVSVTYIPKPITNHKIRLNTDSVMN